VTKPPESPVGAMKRPCRRCGQQTSVLTLSAGGYGPVCASMLGLTGSTLDIGHEGPDLLDLLDETTQQ
jgi:hypothetical protein